MGLTTGDTIGLDIHISRQYKIREEHSTNLSVCDWIGEKGVSVSLGLVHSCLCSDACIAPDCSDEDGAQSKARNLSVVDLFSNPASHQNKVSGEEAQMPRGSFK